MPSDITLCGGQNCPLKENCLRCTAVCYGRQDFFGSSPYNAALNTCDYFWDDRPRDEKIRQLAYQLWEKSGGKSGDALAYWLQAREQLIDRLRNS